MLTHLTVQDVALVARLDLTFDDGMTVVTGETGAGKSIMLDALGLALGDRADVGLIAGDAGKAEVHASFDITDNEAAIAWLAERELDTEDRACLLRRVVARDGRSRGFINGTPATIGDMKVLGEMLLDIHSQHEHQSLLKKDTHRRLLDEFGDLVTLAEEVRSLYSDWQEASRTLDELIATLEEQSSRLQLLEYQAQELEALAITEDEPVRLEEEQRLLANAETILQSLNEAVDLCSEQEPANALSLVSRAIQHLSATGLDAAAPIAEMLESSRIQLQEAVQDMTHLIDTIEIDPARLNQVEARLDAIYSIARKHRVEPEALPALFTRISREIGTLSNIDAAIDDKRRELEALEARYVGAAEKLGKARSKAARSLTDRVSEQLAGLGMQGARFEVAVRPREPAEPHANGLDDIEFLVTTNPGQPPAPLNRIASGGELSRISLAIQVVTADTSHVPTLIFDEVDVGIGGGVAEVVGTLLRQLGEKAQIVCVTHLPQVAAQGHHHLRVEKSSDLRRATTQVVPLDDREKIEEIARMLGGVELTKQSLAHAREMFTTAQTSR